MEKPTHEEKEEVLGVLQLADSVMKRPDIVEQTGISEYKIIGCLRSLKEEGLIEWGAYPIEGEIEVFYGISEEGLAYLDEG